MDIGNRLRIVREENQLSQTDLAKRMDLSQKTISSWEKNRTHPKLKELNKLCELYGCTYEYLTGTKQHNVNDVTVDDILIRIKSFDVQTLTLIKTQIENELDIKIELENAKKESDRLKKLIEAYENKLNELDYIKRKKQ